jgi:ABC-type uncharacterized transport system YnjBCD substrate-binding protein
MDDKTLSKIISQIHRRFPEFSDSKPKVHTRNTAQPKSAGADQTYLLTFRTSSKVMSASGKKSIPRSVRVVVSEQGRILKITTSR